MHLYPRRRNVAAQVAEKLKTVTYATPRVEESRIIFFDGRIYLNLSKTIQSAAGLNALKPAAKGAPLNVQITILLLTLIIHNSAVILLELYR